MIKKLRSKLFSKKILIIFFLFIAFLFRLIDLNNTPSGLHADEASFLLNAKSILATGRDEDGRLLPFNLHSLIDPKPALYTYLQVPTVWLFGPSTFAARLPAVILGVLSIYLTYLFFKKLNQEKIGFVVLVLLTISPWHIVVSRATQEVILSFFFFILALICFFDLLKYQNKKQYLSLFITAFLSMYAYHSAKILLPLLILGYLLIVFRQKKITLKTSIKILMMIFLALSLSFVFQESRTRFASIGIFGNQEPLNKIFEQTTLATGKAPLLVLRSFYNKPAAYFYQLAKEYLQYFSLDFLFLSWGEPKRYIVPNHGLFYLINLPFLFLGLFRSTQKKDKTLFYLFLIFTLLAPLPAALTAQETPSMIRTFSMVLPICYFIAEGLIYFFSWKKARSLLFMTLFFSVYLWQIAYFQMQFFIQEKIYQPWSRNKPFSEIADYVKRIEMDYSLIYTTNDLRPLYTYFALADLISLDQLQANPLARNNDDYQIGKYRFNRKACDFPEITEGVLYIAEVQCREKNKQLNDLKVLATISYPDGLPVYHLLTVNNDNETK